MRFLVILFLKLFNDIGLTYKLPIIIICLGTIDEEWAVRLGVTSIQLQSKDYLYNTQTNNNLLEQ